MRILKQREEQLRLRLASLGQNGTMATSPIFSLTSPAKISSPPPNAYSYSSLSPTPPPRAAKSPVPPPLSSSMHSSVSETNLFAPRGYSFGPNTSPQTSLKTPPSTRTSFSPPTVQRPVPNQRSSSPLGRSISPSSRKQNRQTQPHQNLSTSPKNSPASTPQKLPPPTLPPARQKMTSSGSGTTTTTTGFTGTTSSPSFSRCYTSFQGGERANTPGGGGGERGGVNARMKHPKRSMIGSRGRVGGSLVVVKKRSKKGEDDDDSEEVDDDSSSSSSSSGSGLCLSGGGVDSPVSSGYCFCFVLFFFELFNSLSCDFFLIYFILE